MRWIRWMAGVGALAACTLVGSDVLAGNGTAPEPTGTIYFQDLSTLDPADNSVGLHAMDGDGANATLLLRTDRYVRPSRVLHGPGAPDRWFLTLKTIEGAEVGGNPRRDVFAVRADGSEVRITSDPTMEFWMPEWGFELAGQDYDRAVVSLLGRRWTSDAHDATVVEGTAGLYLVLVSFVGTPSVRGALGPEGPASETADPILWGRFYDASVEDRDSPEYLASVGGPRPDVASYSWGAGGNYYEFLAVQDLDPNNPRIRFTYWNGLSTIGGIQAADLEVEWSARLPGRDPRWLGPQDKVVFSRSTRDPATGTEWWEIQSGHANAWLAGYGVLTEAAVAAPANASTTRSLARPFLSPEGYHVAFQLRVTGTGTTNCILRATAGLGPTNLTPGVKRAAAGEGGMVLVDWR